MDITTSLAWRRPAVGVLRVEQEIIRGLLEEIENGNLVEYNSERPVPADNRVQLAFCRLDKNTVSYRHVPASRAAEVLQPAWSAQIEDKATASPITGPLSTGRYQVLRRRLKRVLPPVLLDATRFLITEWNNERSQYEALSSISSSGSLREIIEEFPVAFKNCDIYLSVGGDWDHNDYNLLYRLKNSTGFGCILCCYDLIPIFYPHLVIRGTREKFREHLINLCHIADDVLAISQTSAVDLKEFIVDQEIGRHPRIHAIPLADQVKSQESRPVDVLVNTRFIIYVSTIEARKNHWTLLRAWELLSQEANLTNVKLVLIGMLGWGIGDLVSEMPLNPRLNSRTMILDRVSDAELNWLYQNCEFTVFPSVYEGWGLAASESLQWRKVALVSDAPALREATQNLMPVLPAFDVTSWAFEIKRLLTDASHRRTLEDSILENYKNRSWQDYFRDVLVVIRSVNDASDKNFANFAVSDKELPSWRADQSP